MEGFSKKDGDCPQLLDLIPKDREWLQQRNENRSHGSSEEKKLELRLGPPGEEGWTIRDGTKNNSRERGYFSNMNNNGGQNQNLSSPWSSSSYQESLQEVAEKKAFSPGCADTAVPNSSQKRTASTPAPVVGWPPIRSFRKNLASGSSSKPTPESQNVLPSKATSEKLVEKCRKGLFVKINMDGVPIGRKVDLKAYDSYEKLSSAADELFRGLLAAQRDSSASGIQNWQEGGKAIAGLLDGSGEYTLVYEDNEGDIILVGDVPWHMFVSTVKRLRVLKSSELSKLCVGSKQEKMCYVEMKKKEQYLSKEF